MMADICMICQSCLLTVQISNELFIAYLLMAFGIGVIIGEIVLCKNRSELFVKFSKEAKEIADGLSHRIQLFLQTTYQASIRIKLIFNNFPTYLKLGDKYIQLIDKDVSVDDEEDIIIDGDKALEIYLQNQSKDKK